MMRPRVAGMNEVDDSILELFDRQDEGICLPPTPVHYNLVEVYGATDKSRDTVARRMRQLTKRGLLEKVEKNKGYYRMTEKGRRYLRGDIKAEKLQIDEDS